VTTLPVAGGFGLGSRRATNARVARRNRRRAILGRFLGLIPLSLATIVVLLAVALAIVIAGK
jgi:hypothetical protein